MTIDLDSYLGVHAKALMIRDQRASQLANNLANADTPNYKAKDIDFNATLKQAMSSSSASRLINDQPGHIIAKNGYSSQTMYRMPTQSSLDGNTVDKDIETTEFLRNSLSYQASLTFLDSKIKNMMLALRGE